MQSRWGKVANPRLLAVYINTKQGLTFGNVAEKALC